MEGNSQCEELKSRVETLSGKSNLLRDEIKKRKNEIKFFKNTIKNAKNTYKNLATKYGVSISVGNVSKKITENMVTVGGMINDRIGAPSSREVEDAFNNYNNTKFQLEDKIEDIEKEIQKIGKDINKIQEQKESLVEEMRNIGCYKR